MFKDLYEAEEKHSDVTRIVCNEQTHFKAQKIVLKASQI